MARKPRQGSGSGFYHYIARGVTKKALFHRAEDYQFFLKLVTEYKSRFSVTLYHYCLMTNHTHLLVSASDIVALSRFAHFIQRRYAYYYCKAYLWQGQVFQRRFRSLPIENDAYLLECGRYIERNPLSADLVKDLVDYAYSSYRFYAQGAPCDLLTRNPLYETLGDTELERRAAYRAYLMQPRQNEMVLEMKS